MAGLVSGGVPDQTRRGSGAQGSHQVLVCFESVISRR